MNETNLSAWRCTDCYLEFVILCLNTHQGDFNGDPACPKCNEADAVTKIDCLDVKVTYKDLQYEMKMKPKEIPLA